MAVLNLRLPDEMRDRFKSACAWKGQTMTDNLLAYIANTIKATEKEWVARGKSKK
jgi:hypothetical protein